MIRNRHRKTLVIWVILTLWIVFSGTYCARGFRPDPYNEQEVRRLIKEFHRIDHHANEEHPLVQAIFQKGRDAIRPLLEIMAGSDCGDCRWATKRCLPLMMEQDPAVRDQAGLIISKQILESWDTKYVLDLLYIINVGHFSRDSKGKSKKFPLSQDIIHALKQLLHHSDYLDSKVQYEAHSILSYHNVEMSREIVAKVYLDAIWSKWSDVRYFVWGHIKENGYLDRPEFQDVVYAALDKEDDPSVSTRIIECIIVKLTPVDKRIILRLINIIAESITKEERKGFDENLRLLTKLTGVKFGKVNAYSEIEVKREVIRNWRDWWVNNKDSLIWDKENKQFLVDE